MINNSVFGLSTLKTVENAKCKLTQNAQKIGMHESHVDIMRYKKLGMFEGYKKRCSVHTFSHRNHRLPQQVPGRFAGMHPTFASACGAPPGYRTPKMNKIRLRTHVASRPGSVFGVFGPENHRNFIQPRNTTNFGVRALHGYCSTWKKWARLADAKERRTPEGPVRP